MKKIIMIISIATMACANFAFATDLTPTTTDAGKTVSGDGKQLGKLSASVMLGGKYDTTGYAITTSHLKGSKTFGTAHNATNIYAKESLDTGVPSASDSSAFSTGWTAM